MATVAVWCCDKCIVVLLNNCDYHQLNFFCCFFASTIVLQCISKSDLPNFVMYRFEWNGLL